MSNKTYVIPGTLHFKDAGRASQQVELCIVAEDRDDAHWQAAHGVIELSVARIYPEARNVEYDRRRMRLKK